jgi:hypothetical protein
MRGGENSMSRDGRASAHALRRATCLGSGLLGPPLVSPPSGIQVLIRPVPI